MQYRCSKCKVEQDETEFYWDKVRQRYQSWCRSCRREAARWAGKAKTPAQHKASSLQTLYGITIDEYWQMFEEQDGLCAVCGCENGKKLLVVDHCHETSRVRGLLCDNCNWGLGQFKDSIERLRQAIKYLENSCSTAL